MIEQSTLLFLDDLNYNNYREWFHENRIRYDAAKENVMEFALALIDGINRFDPSLGYPEDPRKLMFRINRDTRFSKSKEPYKDHIGVIMNADGRTTSLLSGYYLHVAPRGCFVSSGLYAVPAPLLHIVRSEIDLQWDRFHGLVTEPAFREAFGDLSRDDRVLTRVPRGFDKESPAAEYLKLTYFYVWKKFDDTEVCSPEFESLALHYFELMKPLNDFWNEIIKNHGDVDLRGSK